MRCAAATIPGPCTAGRASWPAGLAVAVLLSICPPPAFAGPWAREDGAVFLSLMLSAEEPRTAFVTGQFTADPAVSVYGELGLGQGFTAGIDRA